MTAFIDMPVKSRFKFMLDNAQNTIMAYIKGPVCRGQLALNVINDRFWVFFLDPDKADIPEVNEFYRSQADNLKLPAEQEVIRFQSQTGLSTHANKRVILKQNLSLRTTGLSMAKTYRLTSFGMVTAPTQVQH